MPFSINGKIISQRVLETEIHILSEIYNDYEALFRTSGSDFKKMFTDEAKEAIIERTLLVEKADEYDFVIPEELLKSKIANLNKFGPKDLSEAEKNDLAAEQAKVDLLTEHIKKSVSDPEKGVVDNFFNKNMLSVLAILKRIHAFRIVKYFSNYDSRESTKEALQVICDKLKNGENFIELANKYSDEKIKDGDLGYVQLSELVDIFDHPVASLEPGEYFGPFSFNKGYQVVLVKDSIDHFDNPYEMFKDKISEVLHVGARDKAVEKLKKDLRENAVIIFS